jgi:cell division protein FtsI/penicillin-binding protein 2
VCQPGSVGAIRFVAIVTVTSVLAAGCSLFEQGPDPRNQAADATQALLDAWATGETADAGAATDDPTAAAELLGAVGNRLAVTAVSGEAGVPATCEDDGPCQVPATITLTLGSLGDWTYDTVVEAYLSGQGQGDEDQQAWTVRWAPSVVHPRLAAESELGRVRELPPRASILDRQGRPLTEDRPVVTVGVEPRRLVAPEAVYAGLEQLGVDPARMAERVDAAPPDQFVEAVTVRSAVWAEQGSDLAEQPGVVVREGTRSLAPTASFARALLGSVGPATEELLAAAGPTASAADQVGTSGLQAAHQQRLAGRPGGEVRLLRDGEVEEVLHSFEAVPGEPLATSLDLEVQAAAEQAVADAGQQTALVALDVTGGGVLAAANAPEAGLDRALSGQYPPGSTFKVVSTSALLRAGLSPDEPVECPATTTVGGKRFKNYEFSDVPGADFRDAVAASCNTTFVQLTDRLDAAALPAEAAAFGLGAEWDLGVPAFSGSVPEPVDVVDEAAAMIGQSRVLASPLAMAHVAATVAAGRPATPWLAEEPGAAGEPLPAEQAEQLRSLMRTVVTEGTASALAPYGEVHAKTGTAEYGSEDPPRTHAWVIGYRGDVAFAVLVEDGASGSSAAAPVAARFLSALDAG